MPRYKEPKKDAYGGDTRRVGAKNLLSGGFRMRKLTCAKAQVSCALHKGYQ